MCEVVANVFLNPGDGVEDYAFLPDIAGVREVSGAWEDFFKQQLGAANVVTLVDAQAVREEILDAAERAGGMASGGRVWVVYVGHGANVGSGAMLLGADTQQTSRSVTTRGVTQDEVLAAIRSRTEAEVVMVLDACFRGQTPGGEPLLPGLRPAFSSLMLEALSGGARGDDDEVTAGEAVSYVRDGLRRVPGRVQTPQLSGVPGLVLARGVSDLPTSVEESASVLVGTSTRREVSAWSPYWLSLGAGLGSELQSERFTPVVSVRGGAHLGGGEVSRYRLGAELMYVQSENPLYRQAVEAWAARGMWGRCCRRMFRVV